MELAVAGQPIPIEVTFDTGLLFVALKVYDVTAGFPGSLVATTPMVEYDVGAYGANFSGVATKSYVVSKAVYTSGSYATRDLNYSSGSEAFQVVPPISMLPVTNGTGGAVGKLVASGFNSGKLIAVEERNSL